MSLRDYQPTPQQIAAARQMDAERLERCRRITERYEAEARQEREEAKRKEKLKSEKLKKR